MKVQKVLAGGLAVLMLAVSMPTGAREVSAETITEDRLGDITTDNTESDETANDDQTEAEQDAEENKEEETGQELEQTEPTEDSNLNVSSPLTSIGSNLTLQCPYCPRPPDCFAYLLSTSTGFVMDSL